MAAEPVVDSDVLFTGRAVRRFSAIEVWERYSFYSMFGLLPLFLTASTASGGFGWKPGDALEMFGLYIGVVQAAPFVGGWLADRWLGGRTALAWGAGLMTVGHLLLVAPGLIPHLRAPGAPPLVALLQNFAFPLGDVRGLLNPPPPGVAPAAVLAYAASGWLFYIALACLAIGNGLFKPNISVLVGRLPFRDEPAREAAFLTFYMFINLGGLLAGILGGLIADRLGYDWAFGVAGLGMIAALILVRAFGRAYIDPLSTMPSGRRYGARAASSDSWAWLTPYALLLLFAVLFGVGYFQSSGLVTLFTARRVDRVVAGFSIPPTWFSSLNPIFLLILALPLASLSRKLSPGGGAATSQRFLIGFALTAAAFLLLAGGAAQAGVGGLANPLWIVATYFVLTLAELFIGPSGFAAVSRLAPSGKQNLAMGGWFAGIGLGGWLSGRLGRIGVEESSLGVFLAIAAGGLACALALRGLRGWFARRDA